ncbi:MAG: ABC transporter permease subunit [Sedimentisphaerales bacterium]|nr:ABC transporter permease subunit [Sedimentisphaerales bacterium]
MIASVKKTFLSMVRPKWLTGPIFEKELRVSSRRRRNYVLRFFYILLLTIFVGMVWLSVAEYQGDVTYQRSRMAAAGKEIVMTIVFFQFIATQVLAIVMLSTAISDEVYHRTLGLLMTTPITSLQVVMGKVLSKLLQLGLLLAITLPMLAVVRIFGGIPWGYLLSSFCVTLTAVLFAGSVSLLISINNRRAYAVIIRTGFVLLSFYLIIPLILAALMGYLVPLFGPILNVRGFFSPWRWALLAHLNPFYGIMANTERMMSPGTRGMPFIWPVHCLVMLGLSALVLTWSAKIVRRVALRQVTGQLDPSAGGLKVGRKRCRDSAPVAEGRVKRVIGPAVVWKELRAPLIQGVDHRNSYIGLAATLGMLLLTYITGYLDRSLREEFWHVSYGLLFVFIGIIVATVFSATRITTEKEAQTWSLLLATPLEDRDILLGKAVSAFRRCLPIWGLLAGHVILFVLVGYIHPIAIFHLAILVTWLTCFVTGTGLYFSARFARTTSAVLASFGVMLSLWAVGPVLAGLLDLMGGSIRGGLLTKYMLIHPAIQTQLILAGAGGAANGRAALAELQYGERSVLGFSLEEFGLSDMTFILTVTALAYVGTGILFFFGAKRRLRRNIV